MPVFLALIGLLGLAAAAPDTADLPDPETAHQRLRELEGVGMGVLGGWAVANIAGGGMGWALADDPRELAFHQGNLAWNTVNLGIAGAALWGQHQRRDDPTPTLAELGQQARRSRIIFAVNGGLDVLYMGAGAWLWSRGLQTDDPRFTGWGQALVLQGGFLFAFDWTMFAANRAVSRRALGPELGLDPLSGTASLRWQW